MDGDSRRDGGAHSLHLQRRTCYPVATIRDESRRGQQHHVESLLMPL
jgi:hypothetical protein